MVEHEGDVLIGYDSQLTGADKVESPDSKVFVNSGVVYGVSGDQRYRNALRYESLPSLPEKDPAEWVERKLLPVLRRIYDHIDPDRNSRDVHLLVAVNGTVFPIFGNLSWNRSNNGEYTIGSGSLYVLGALSAGASVETALAIAAKHDPNTGGTLHCTTAHALLAQYGYVPADASGLKAAA